jgi:hypothetical protein
MRRDRIIGAVERALLGMAMSAAAFMANWVLMRKMRQHQARAAQTRPGA